MVGWKPSCAAQCDILYPSYLRCENRAYTTCTVVVWLVVLPVLARYATATREAMSLSQEREYGSRCRAILLSGALASLPNPCTVLDILRLALTTTILCAPSRAPDRRCERCGAVHVEASLHQGHR